MARKKVHHRRVLLAGVGIFAAAAAVGGRFLYNKASKKQREKIDDWTKDLKEDSIALFRDARVLSRKAYHDAVDRASKKYRMLKDIDARDIERVVKDIKGRWKEVEARVAKSAKKSVRKAKRYLK